MADKQLHFHKSELLAAALPVWRERLVLLLLLAGFLGLAARAAWIQLLAQDFYASQGDRRVHAEAPLAARRGEIQDRHGTVLATSVPSAPGQGFQRRYPDGEIVAALVGFTDVDHRGQEGVERSFDSELTGTDGVRAVTQDRLGRAVADAPETVVAVDGRDVRLTLDARIQLLAFRRVKLAVDGHLAKSGSVVVLDARTGDMLAMANYPSFDPNERRHWRQEQLRNRAASDAIEPGSVAKPITMATALDLGRVRPETVFDTGPGRLRFEGATISDVGRFGVLTSLFVGMAPISRPRLIVATLIDESTEGGYYGGQIAAPVSREVLREALRLPDIPIPAS
ncbi:penicillin-binding transpeptidase domain-containing protein [Roseateles chitinivorans]|uniref:penicillin-binding transpeptidase domain-containing protein n=1 Tax=Roseateles chitinivorans TaxID=2917965 RepID=UPI003D67638E